MTHTLYFLSLAPLLPPPSSASLFHLMVPRNKDRRQNKRADITILEEPVAKGVIETNPDLTYITLTSGFNVSLEDVCVAIAVKLGNTELQTKINEVLNQITEADRNSLMDQAIQLSAE